MRRGRIRYKKLFLTLFFFVGFCAALFYGARFFLNRYISTSAPPAGTQYCLVMGIRGAGANQADSLVLLATDTEKQTLYALSLPGNTQAGKESGELLLLKDVYADGGAERTVSAVENLLHIRIGKYAVVDEENFAQMVDWFGGTDFYVERDMVHEDETKQPDIQLKQGVQRLNGVQAAGYVRFFASKDDEIGRLQRGERFMKAALGELRSCFSPYLWWQVRKNWQLSDTNLTAEEAASWLHDVLNFPEENIHFVILPGESKKLGNDFIWQVNPVEIQRMVGLILNHETGNEKGE